MMSYLRVLLLLFSVETCAGIRIKHKQKYSACTYSLKMPQHLNWGGMRGRRGMFSALSRKKGNDSKTSQRLFTPFIPPSDSCILSGRCCQQPSARGTKLWTSPCPIHGAFFSIQAPVPWSRCNRRVIFAPPWRRLQVTRRLEAVRGPCTTAKL